ncbi:hypothetical protein ACWKSP_26590 [Micromonosporaceae bacterium Da 78-11]
MTWDVFYIVAGENGIKLGVSSGDAKFRLGTHRLDGYAEVVRLLVGLPGDEAPTLERTCISAMSDAGIPPNRGREYFPLDALPIAVDIADGWLSSPSTPSRVLLAA